MFEKYEIPRFPNLKTYLLNRNWSMEQYEEYDNYFCFKHPENPEKVRITLTSDVLDDVYEDYVYKALRTLSAFEKKEIDVLLVDISSQLTSQLIIRIPGDSKMSFSHYDELYNRTKEYLCSSYSHVGNPRTIVKRPSSSSKVLDAFHLAPPKAGSFIYTIEASKSQSNIKQDSNSLACSSIERTYNTLQQITSNPDQDLPAFITSHYKKDSIDAGSLYVLSSLSQQFRSRYRLELEYYFQLYKGGNLYKNKVGNSYEEPIKINEALDDKVQSTWAYFMSQGSDIDSGPYTGQAYQIWDDRVRFKSTYAIYNTAQMIDISFDKINDEQKELLYKAHQEKLTLSLDCSIARGRKVFRATKINSLDIIQE